MEINGNLHHASLAFWKKYGEVNYWHFFAGLCYNLLKPSTFCLFSSVQMVRM